MERGLLTYSGIIAKVHALEGHLLVQEDYEKIASLESTSDFITFLKNKRGYQKVFQNYDESTLHRVKIEQLLSIAPILDLERLYQFATVEQRPILSLLLVRYEVRTVKALLELVYSKEMPSNFYSFDPFFAAHSHIPVEALAASKTMDEFIQNLQGTRYYDLFLRLQATGHTTLRDYAVQLDIFYFTYVWKTKDRILKGTNKKIITELYGVQADLLNLLWIYRSKQFFDMDPTEILTTILPIHYHLKKDELKVLIEAISAEEFMKLAQNTYYGKGHLSLATLDMETFYKKNSLLVYKRLSSTYSISMAPVLRFLYEKEQELDRLTTALECIRYHLEPNELLKYLML